MSFEDFLSAARERAKQPQAPTYAERLAALNEELRDPADERRAKIEALAEHGATEGERAAARVALARLDSRSEADDLEAAMIEDMDALDAEEVAEAEEFLF